MAALNEAVRHTALREMLVLSWKLLTALLNRANELTVFVRNRGAATATVTDHWAAWLAETPFYTGVGERELWIPIEPWKEGLSSLASCVVNFHSNERA